MNIIVENRTQERTMSDWGPYPVGYGLYFTLYFWLGTETILEASAWYNNSEIERYNEECILSLVIFVVLRVCGADDFKPLGKEVKHIACIGRNKSGEKLRNEQ